MDLHLSTYPIDYILVSVTLILSAFLLVSGKTCPPPLQTWPSDADPGLSPPPPLLLLLLFSHSIMSDSATSWTATRQTSLSFTTSRIMSFTTLKLTAMESVMHPTISSSVVPFSSCPQPFPASGSFPMSHLLSAACDMQAPLPKHLSRCCSISISYHKPFTESVPPKASRDSLPRGH